MINTNKVIIVLYVGYNNHFGTNENIDVIAPVGHNINSTFTLNNKSIT